MPNELILIVEDDPLSAKLAAEVLEVHGYRTIVAATGAAALEAMAHKPGLVLMDIQLPDTDGVAVLSQLRQDPLTAAIPIIAVTAMAMPGDRERFLQAGFDGYVSKPIDVRGLVDEVGRRLAARGAS